MSDKFLMSVTIIGESLLDTIPPIHLLSALGFAGALGKLNFTALTNIYKDGLEFLEIIYGVS